MKIEALTQHMQSKEIISYALPQVKVNHGKETKGRVQGEKKDLNFVNEEPSSY